jgi:hypothetical protein
VIESTDAAKKPKSALAALMVFGMNFWVPIFLVADSGGWN